MMLILLIFWEKHNISRSFIQRIQERRLLTEDLIFLRGLRHPMTKALPIQYYGRMRSISQKRNVKLVIIVMKIFHTGYGKPTFKEFDEIIFGVVLLTDL